MLARLPANEPRGWGGVIVRQASSFGKAGAGLIAQVQERRDGNPGSFH